MKNHADTPIDRLMRIPAAKPHHRSEHICTDNVLASGWFQPPSPYRIRVDAIRGGCMSHAIRTVSSNIWDDVRTIQALYRREEVGAADVFLRLRGFFVVLTPLRSRAFVSWPHPGKLRTSQFLTETAAFMTGTAGHDERSHGGRGGRRVNIFGDWHNVAGRECALRRASGKHRRRHICSLMGMLAVGRTVSDAYLTGPKPDVSVRDAPRRQARTPSRKSNIWPARAHSPARQTAR